MQAIVAYGATSGPNNSTAKIHAASGVFAAPASTLTSPKPANITGFKLNKLANVTPAVDPIKNMGVITPPLPPKANVTAVAIIFIINAYHIISPVVNAVSMLFKPSPRKSLENIRVIPIKSNPPMTPL